MTALDTINSMIDNNMLDKSMTITEVQSVLTDTWIEAVRNGEEPQYDVAEILDTWIRNFC